MAQSLPCLFKFMDEGKYENTKKTMDRTGYWIVVTFSTWIYKSEHIREKLRFFDGTVTFEATQEVEGEVKTENMVLPEEFNGQRSLCLKQRIQLLRFLDGEEIYQYGRDENTPNF